MAVAIIVIISVIIVVSRRLEEESALALRSVPISRAFRRRIERIQDISAGRRRRSDGGGRRSEEVVGVEAAVGRVARGAGRAGQLGRDAGRLELVEKVDVVEEVGGGDGGRNEGGAALSRRVGDGGRRRGSRRLHG